MSKNETGGQEPGNSEQKNLGYEGIGMNPSDFLRYLSLQVARTGNLLHLTDVTYGPDGNLESYTIEQFPLVEPKK